jgi:hypothetical protein
MIFAAIDDYSAIAAKVDPVHDFAADRAFYVKCALVAVFYYFFDIIQLTSVDRENVGNSSLQKRFQFIRVKEKSKTTFASFYKKFAANVQIYGSQPDAATRADPFQLCFMGCIVVNPFKIGVTEATAISTPY